MISNNFVKLATRSRLLTQQSRGIKGLPSYDPAAAIPMKWGVVYMGVFMGFWGVCYLVNPFLDRDVMTETYDVKWQKKN